MPCKCNIDKTYLENQYNKNKTLKELGKIFNCTDVTILRRLHEYNIKTRRKGWHLPNRQKDINIRKKISDTRKKLFELGILDLSGKNNPAYIDGTYCSGTRPSRKKWNKIRKIVLERDNYMCKICGKTSKDIRVDVHHITPWRICKEHKPENCVTLCVSCHGKISGSNKLKADYKEIRVSL